MARNNIEQPPQANLVSMSVPDVPDELAADASRELTLVTLAFTDLDG